MPIFLRSWWHLSSSVAVDLASSWNPQVPMWELVVEVYGDPKPSQASASDNVFQLWKCSCLSDFLGSLHFLDRSNHYTLVHKPSLIWVHNSNLIKTSSFGSAVASLTFLDHFIFLDRSNHYTLVHKPSLIWVHNSNLIKTQMNSCLKPSIKSPISDAAILQFKFIYLSGIKSKRFTNFLPTFHMGCELNS